MAFAERFEEKLRADGTPALIEMLHGGFAFDQTIGGEICAVRRIRDRHIRVGGGDKGPENEWLETDFFIFPQNGQKDKLMTGVVMTVMKPKLMLPFLCSLTGVASVAAVIVLITVGWLIIRKIIKIDV